MFYDRFLEICKQHNVSPSQVAIQCGFNKSSVTNWKKNGYAPRQEILIKIADYFNVTVDYLLDKTESLYTKKECDICGKIYNDKDEIAVLEHAEYHNKFITACKFFGEYWVITSKEEENRKMQCRTIINHASEHGISTLVDAVSDLYGAYFSRSLRYSDYNLNHPKVNEFIAMMLYQPHQKKMILSKLPNEAIKKLLAFYGEKPGIEDGKSYYNIPDGEKKIINFTVPTDEDIKFALFGGDEDITDEMLDEVKAFAQFVKNKYKKD